MSEYPGDIRPLMQQLSRARTERQGSLARLKREVDALRGDACARLLDMRRDRNQQRRKDAERLERMRRALTEGRAELSDRVETFRRETSMAQHEVRSRLSDQLNHSRLRTQRAVAAIVAVTRMAKQSRFRSGSLNLAPGRAPSLSSSNPIATAPRRERVLDFLDGL